MRRGKKREETREFGREKMVDANYATGGKTTGFCRAPRESLEYAIDATRGRCCS